jgi:transcriptional regulator with PAS, ATPase and Fis domain
MEVVGEKAIGSLELADCEVVISRGASFMALNARFQNSLPCVELQVSGYDVIRALHKCRSLYGPDNIAVIGSQNMVDGVQDVASGFGVNLLHFIATDENDTRNCLKKSLDQGVREVVGGALTHRVAKEFGIDVIIIESGESALRYAIEEAKRTALAVRQERAKSIRLHTILDSIHVSVIAVDAQGVITTCNTPAKVSLVQNRHPEAELIGRHISEVMPDSGISDVLESAAPQLGVVYQREKDAFVANFQPILMDNLVTGAVATFQEAISLQEIEGHIRSATYKKGHTARYTFNDCIGDSIAIQEALVKAIKFSRVDSNVILYGETGTGKEVFAQSIHNASARRAGLFVAVNCAALPESLLESELFGYVSGAFTGAARGGKMGLFEMAHGGTIFLDEVSEIPFALQGRLLRVLQEQKVMRLGHDRVLPIDVRVIAASNENLFDRAARGLFRLDLLYRLDVLHLNIPPLRERNKDIPVLAAKFLREFGLKLRGQSISLADEAAETLLLHDWPGNVRELMNMCERAAALASGQSIQPKDIYEVMDQFKSSCPLPVRSVPVAVDRAAPPPALDEILSLTGNNKTKAARLLGISRTTLWRRMRASGAQRLEATTALISSGKNIRRPQGRI